MSNQDKFLRGAGAHAPPPAAPGHKVEEADDVEFLSAAQYELLANQPEMQQLLSNPELQSVVRSVDSAADREKALVKALESPNFKEFTDKILNIVSPPETL
ncbi:hypothetical protein ACKKBF_B00075 [Auxenochlorella protothecoides x Auxenochlorella symbiontica]